MLEMLSNPQTKLLEYANNQDVSKFYEGNGDFGVDVIII